MWQKILGLFLPSIGKAIEEAVTDKDLANRLKADITAQMLALQGAELDAQAKVLVAELQGKSWLQRAWRPLTMLSFVFIIFNNYVIVPYAVAFAGPDSVPMLEIPPGMWGLLTVGIGGYVGGRTFEKIKGVD